MNYISSAFSFQMLFGTKGGISWENISESEFYEEAHDAKSCVGTLEIANILGVEYNREPICLKDGDKLYLCQVYGGKVPLGATHLPEGCNLKYTKIEV